MDLKEIQKLIKLAKKSGLIHIKVDGVELEFIQEAVRPKITRHELTDKIETEKQDEMSALFWSVQNLDPLAEAQ